MVVLTSHAQAPAGTGASSMLRVGLAPILVPNRIASETTPGTYRQGNTRRQMGQGASLAAAADSLVQRQDVGR